MVLVSGVFPALKSISESIARRGVIDSRRTECLFTLINEEGAQEYEVYSLLLRRFQLLLQPRQSGILLLTFALIRMPYHLELGSDGHSFKGRAIVVNSQSGKHYSKSPIPLVKAEAQKRVLEAAQTKEKK
jgi:hypothetical protein